MLKLGLFRCLTLVGALLLVGGCGSESAEPEPEPEPVEPTGYGSVWSEFLAGAEVEAALPTLARHGLSVSLAWPARAPADAERLELARRAQKAGVEVRPWILLSDEDGYWPGSSNAKSFTAAAEQVLDAWAAAGLPPSTLVVDMEMRKDRALEMNAMLTGGQPDLAGFVKFLKSGMNGAEYAEATSTYRDLVGLARERGWKVHLTTLPQVLDDLADGDDDIRQAFGIPLEGIDWDVVTFQAYRTLFGGLLSGGQIPSSYFVYEYGVDAKSRFGDRAGLDIGMVGQGVSESPVYTEGSELAADVEAAVASGITPARINVYNLDGILGRAPEDQWLTGEPPHPVAPEPDTLTASIRKQSQMLDAVLGQ